MTERRILLVDDQETVLDAVSFRLTLRGYTVATARDVVTAQEVLANQIIHLAVIDLCLKDRTFQNDTSGFLVAQALPSSIPCIIYTAYANDETARRAFEEVKARAVIAKQSSTASEELVAAVDRVFAQDVPVNFALTIQSTVDFAHLAQQLAVAASPGSRVPDAADLRALCQQLFPAALQVDLAPLFPAEAAAEQGQSGAQLLQAQELRRHGKAAPVIVKLGPRDELMDEAERCRLLQPYIGGQRLARLERLAVVRQIAGLVYSLVDSHDGQALGTLTDLLRRQDDTRVVSDLLRDFFQQTLGEIHQAVRSVPLALGEHYTTALHLSVSKLNAALQGLAPHWLTQRDLRLGDLVACAAALAEQRVINPVLWAFPAGSLRREEAVVRPVTLCHGDLHTRNILVDEGGQFWLIDFARVAESHALRDFAELESDIKFRVLAELSRPERLALEMALLAPTHWDDLYSPQRLTAPLEHWRQVITTVRTLVVEQLRLTGDLRDYYEALFWHTLNLVRLRTVDPQGKEDALLCAALLAQRLEQWPGGHLASELEGHLSNLPPISGESRWQRFWRTMLGI
jgi:CheY-like chemotaxis protein